MKQSGDRERMSLYSSVSLASLYHEDVSFLVKDFESTNEPIEKRSTTINTKKFFMEVDVLLEKTELNER